LIDIKEKLLSKTEIQLPEEFLKKWVKTINKELTEEQVESEFYHFLEDLRWSLIKSKIAKENEIKVEPDDLNAEAANLIKNQFKMYGLNDVPEEYLIKYTNDILKNKEEVEKLYQQILERKVVEFVSDQIKLELKEITQEEFYELFK
jgi:trigger factor